MIRFVHGEHIQRDGLPVIELYANDGLVAVIYPAAHGVRIVSRHFAPHPVELDQSFPPALRILFAGATPAGRGRYDA